MNIHRKIIESSRRGTVELTPQTCLQFTERAILVKIKFYIELFQNAEEKRSEEK